MKRILIVLCMLSMTSCGGGGGGGGGGGDKSNVSGENVSSASKSSASSANDFLSAGMYPAINGSGYSEFHKFKLEENGYLDITTYKATVALYTSSLALIDSRIDHTDYINAGEYNLKFTYEATSNTPGNITIFSLQLKKYFDLPKVESKIYKAVGSFTAYSEYYKLDMASGGYIDVTTTKADVYVYNKTLFGDDRMSLNTHYEHVLGNKYLEAGEYLIKFTYVATSNTPGTVSFQKN